MGRKRGALSLVGDVVLLEADLAETCGVDVGGTPINFNVTFAGELDVAIVALLAEGGAGWFEAVGDCYYFIAGFGNWV